MVKVSSEENAGPDNASHNNKSQQRRKRRKKKEAELKKEAKRNERVLAAYKLVEFKNDGKKADNKLVEFYGQRVTPLAREKMETIVPILRRCATVADLRNFVAEFPAFELGTLVLKNYHDKECTTCSNLGHPPEVCPKRWKNGKWYTICRGCKHHRCQEWNLCKYCRKGAHCSKKCPERRKKFEDEEDED